VETEKEILNKFLVEVFNEILRTEEQMIAENGYDNLSVREMHVIEAVCTCASTGKNTATDIASFLGVVPGTLTTAINILEKKGYIYREKSQNDRRVVRIKATESGEKVNEDHKRFHGQMIDGVLSALTPEQTVVFMRGLSGVADFFKQNGYKGERKNDKNNG